MKCANGLVDIMGKGNTNTINMNGENINDKFKMMAYDTTGKEHKNETDHSVASVIHEGLVGLLTTKGEDLFNFGFSELAYRYTTGRMFDEILDEVDKQKEIKYRDNVIEVDFGKDK